jgi:hypothetical protein
MRQFPLPSGVPRPAAISGYLLALFALCALTWALWQWRFIPVAGSPALTLEYTPEGVTRTPTGPVVMDGKTLTLSAGGEIPRVEYRWTETPPARYAHIAMEVSCRGIEVGKMPWDDGRVVLGWKDGAGMTVAGHLPLWSARGNHPLQFRDMVVPLGRNGTLPRISIENRGSAGEFTVQSFQVQPVEQRPGIPIAVGGILLGWLALSFFGMKQWVAEARVPGLRIALAAALWVGFAWVSCFPGPWIPFRPVGQHFPIPAVPPPAETKPAPAPPVPTMSAPVAEARPPIATPVASAPAPAVPVATPERLEGGLFRWFLNQLPYLKRPIHFVAFAVLTTLLALLTGNWRAIWPALTLAAFSEFCQWAFGFGFEWGDVLDLALDSAAVFAGILVWGRAVRLKGKAQASGPERVQAPVVDG